MRDVTATSNRCRRARGGRRPAGAAPAKAAHARIACALRASIAMLLLGVLGLGAQPGEAAELRRLKVGVPDIEIFFYQGEVRNGDAFRLQAALAKVAPNKRVAILLHSTGGVYAEGKALGRLFYNAKISTFVLGNGGNCLSACAMAFLGGRDSVTGAPLRVIIQGGALGFHQFRPSYPPDRKFTKAEIEKTVGDVQKVVFEDLKYLKEIKQDPRTYRRVVAEPAESMLLIRDSAALENGFHVIDAEQRSLIGPDAILDRMKTK